MQLPSPKYETSSLEVVNNHSTKRATILLHRFRAPMPSGSGTSATPPTPSGAWRPNSTGSAINRNSEQTYSSLEASESSWDQNYITFFDINVAQCYKAITALPAYNMTLVGTLVNQYPNSLFGALVCSF